MTDDQFRAFMAEQKASNAKTDALFEALMVPSPGQQRSLLDRMAAVTISFESGRVIGRLVVWLAGVVAAISALAAWAWHGGTIR